MAFSLIKSTTLSLTLFSTLLFFIFLHFYSPNCPSTFSLIPRRSLSIQNNATALTCSSILQTPPSQRCAFSRRHCTSQDSAGILNYYSLHFCLFHETPSLSIPFLSLAVLLHFYILVTTAQNRFSVVVTHLATHLNLSPSMGAVTLLALGNGAPDVFASVAAVGSGHARTGFGAILSAGTFVSALVVGFVAIYAAPFSVSPAPFIRDVLFYLIAALFLFYVYLSAEIFLWQAVGFVGFYLFFVGFVFWMDFGMDGGKLKAEIGNGEIRSVEIEMGNDCESGEFGVKFKHEKRGSAVLQMFEKVDLVLLFMFSYGDRKSVV